LIFEIILPTKGFAKAKSKIDSLEYKYEFYEKLTSVYSKYKGSEDELTHVHNETSINKIKQFIDDIIYKNISLNRFSTYLPQNNLAQRLYNLIINKKFLYLAVTVYLLIILKYIYNKYKHSVFDLILVKLIARFLKYIINLPIINNLAVAFKSLIVGFVTLLVNY
jgi:hypothetical protein